MLIEKTKIYGVTGIGGSDPTLERTDAAIDLNFTIGDGEIQSDFDRCYPWSDMQEIVDEWGNVFVRIPKFYAKVSKNGDGTFKYQISGCRYEGFSTLFIDGKGGEIPYVLVGKYEGSGSSSHVFSMSGKRVLTNIGIDNYRTACQENGKGYQQYDFLIDTIIKQLFTIEFATTDCQSIMAGWTNRNNNTDLLTGYTDFIRSASGSGDSTLGMNGTTFNTDGRHACKYRGIENPWGNFYKWCDGINFGDGNKVRKEKICVCTDPTKYKSGEYSPPYFYMGDRSIKNGHSKTITPFERMPLLGYTTESDGDNRTYYSDAYYAAGTCLMVGGRYVNEADAGLWLYFSTSGDPSVNTAGRLCYKPIQNS